MVDDNNSEMNIQNQSATYKGVEINPPVFFISAILIITLVVLTLALPEEAASLFDIALKFVTNQFNSAMATMANIIALICIALMLSPYGKVRLGGLEAKPEFGYTAWVAMLFAAGVGVGLVFFGVAEPVAHFSSSYAPDAGQAGSYAPLGGAPGDMQAAKDIAMSATIMHWSIHVWAIYAMVALSLALFSYNFGLPLSIRSAFQPLIGKYTWGTFGNFIDILAILATVFGLATSLGLGANQAMSGVNFLFGAEINTINQIMLVMAVAGVTLLSVSLGLDKGVKRLSEVNMFLAAMLALFVIVVGPTLLILTDVFSNIGAYFSNIIALSDITDRDDQLFFNDWTIFYWAWWAAWAPFVGMFIARVSKGRTVREFLFFALLVPSLVGAIWMTVFGTSAIDQIVTHGNTALVEAESSMKLFVMLQQLPFTEIVSMFAIVLLLIFFTTSWDSGALVLDTMASGGNINTSKFQKVFWVVLVGCVAIALHLGGGLRSLQAATNVLGLPFMFVILLMSIGVIKGLRKAYHDQGLK